jgi:ferric enterobactin receptor
MALAVFASLAASSPAALAAEGEGEEATLSEVRVLGTAEETLRQAPGVSTITAEDIEKRPPARDLSEIIRTMPGVNLTGNSSSGAYGNSRQIDLRGMGPENTLILIDGKPVSSRDSVRMGRNGERNTRGDSNWVPADAIESIEVIRGPAAARYGSGAAGGVVNIITKKPTKALSGGITTYYEQPENRHEGGSKRLSFHAAGPLSERFSFRFYGNVAKQDADDAKLNPVIHGTDSNGNPVVNPGAAGREGVRNKDINGLIRWDFLPGQVLELESGFSRQGNIYAGERLFNGSNDTMAGLAASGAETNTMYRRTQSVTHRGDWGEGRTSRLTAFHEETVNSRLNEGLAGGGEGAISDPGKRSTSQFDTYQLTGEFNAPLKLGGFDQVLTLGGEWKKQKLDDDYAVSTELLRPGNAASTERDKDPKSEAKLWALYVEDNIELMPDVILTPGLRLDHHEEFGANWSPSLNASWNFAPAWTLKGGIARAFKAPNLYQLNPGYAYQTRGNGCPTTVNRPNSEPCVIYGNANLDPETSINKELGIAYSAGGWEAGLTYFRNDYKNKIIADMGEGAGHLEGSGANGYYAFQWFNSGKAVVRGWEGFLHVPLARNLKWRNNFTIMNENHSRETRQPLSVVPDYTINSELEWQATEKFSLLLTGTFYGKQEPRTFNTASASALEGDALKKRGKYEIYGLSGSYRLAKDTHLRLGVNNLLDKTLYREDSGAGQGAATYNEPGRAYYVNLTTSF